MFPCLHMSKTNQKTNPKADSSISRAEPWLYLSSHFPRQQGRIVKQGLPSAETDA